MERCILQFVSKCTAEYTVRTDRLQINFFHNKCWNFPILLLGSTTTAYRIRCSKAHCEIWWSNNWSGKSVTTNQEVGYICSSYRTLKNRTVWLPTRSFYQYLWSNQSDLFWCILNFHVVCTLGSLHYSTFCNATCIHVLWRTDGRLLRLKILREVQSTECGLT